MQTETVIFDKVKYDISKEQSAYHGQVDEFYKYDFSFISFLDIIYFIILFYKMWQMRMPNIQVVF